MTTLAIVIPALDEERSIAGVIRGVQRVRDCLIVVADNGSRDATARIAAGCGATVVRVEERGYGAACAAAIETLPPAVSIVAFMDADGADDPNDLPALVQAIERDEADLAIGSRTLGKREPGSLTPQQRIGNSIATALIRLLYGHRYTDLGPFRAIRRDLLARMAMEDRRFGWTVEMQIRALQLGASVAEIPVTYRRRVGRSKISGTFAGVAKAGFWILYTIAKCSLIRPASPAPRPSQHSAP